MELQLSYFKSEKIMLLKCCTQNVSKSGKLSSGHRTGKGEFSFQSPRRGILWQCQRMFKLPYNCTHFTCQQGYAQNPLRQASAVPPRTLRCTSWVQKRQRNQRSNCQQSLDHGKSKGIPEKKSIHFCLIDYTKAFHYVDHKKLWKILKRWEYQTTLPASWETCVWVKKQQLEQDMEQQTGSKLGKEYNKAVYCHSTYYILNHIQVSQEVEKRVWYSHLFNNFLQFIVIHKVKGLSLVNEAEVDVFLELACFLHDPTTVGNLISASSASLKPSLYVRFMQC